MNSFPLSNVNNNKITIQLYYSLMGFKRANNIDFDFHPEIICAKDQVLTVRGYVHFLNYFMFKFFCGNFPQFEFKFLWINYFHFIIYYKSNEQPDLMSHIEYGQTCTQTVNEMCRMFSKQSICRLQLNIWPSSFLSNDIENNEEKILLIFFRHFANDKNFTSELSFNFQAS